MEDQTATQGSAGIQEGGAEPDPFAEIPADTLGDDATLPPNVQPGTLGGDNPSEEAAVQEAEAAAAVEPVEEEPTPDPLAESPTGGEFMEEPPEPDFEPEPEAAAEPEPEQPPAAPVAEEPPVAETPVAEQEPEPSTPVPGSSAVPPSGEPLTPEGEVPPAPVEDPPPAPVEDPPPPPAAEEPPAPEPEAKPEPKKRKRKPRKKKAEKGQRGYVILKLDTAALEDASFAGGGCSPCWIEAFDREIPVGEEGSEPVTIDSRGGEMALRTAYRRLSENGEATYTLVAVPAKLFKPKTVEGKVPENALTIKVN